MLDAFRAFCLSMKEGLDAAFPGGAHTVLLFIGMAIDESLRRAGFVRWCSDRVGSNIAAEILSSGPTVVIVTLWGWMTTGQFILNEAGVAFVEGVLGPAFLAYLANRKPPSPPSGKRRHLTSAVLSFALLGCGYTAEQRSCLGRVEVSEKALLLACAAKHDGVCPDSEIDRIMDDGDKDSFTCLRTY